MGSHFVNLIDNAAPLINRHFQPSYSTRLYFEAKLQQAISARVLYDSRADISFISNYPFDTLPADHLPTSLTRTTSPKTPNNHASHGAHHPDGIPDMQEFPKKPIPGYVPLLLSKYTSPQKEAAFPVN